MKLRIASSLAVVAVVAVGATGCSLIAPQGTLEPYSPSDGVDVNVGDVELRNVLLVADENGENFNVVFTGVNSTGSDAQVQVSFSDASDNVSEATIDLPSGTTAYGNPEGDEQPVVLAVDGAAPGQTVDAYFVAGTSKEVAHHVPVLDGTLAEYQAYVLPAGFGQEDVISSADEDAKTGSDAE